MKKKLSGFLKGALILLLVFAFFTVLDQMIVLESEQSTVWAERKQNRYKQALFGQHNDEIQQNKWMQVKLEELEKDGEFVFPALKWGLEYQSLTYEWPYEMKVDPRTKLLEGSVSYVSPGTRILDGVSGDVYLDLKQGALERVCIGFTPEDSQSWYNARYRELTELYGEAGETVERLYDEGVAHNGVLWRGETTCLQLLIQSDGEGEPQVLLIMGAE